MRTVQILAAKKLVKTTVFCRLVDRFYVVVSTIRSLGKHKHITADFVNSSTTMQQLEPESIVRRTIMQHRPQWRLLSKLMEEILSFRQGHCFRPDYC